MPVITCHETVNTKEGFPITVTCGLHGLLIITRWEKGKCVAQKRMCICTIKACRFCVH